MVAHLATSGHYNATWNALALGRTDEGWTWEVNHKGEILRFEEFGESMIDLVERGADVFVEAVLKEWKAAAVATCLWPWSATFGKQECSGRFASLGSFAKPLVLTPEACSPAGAGGEPATITFHKAIMAPETAARINLNNKPRFLPMRFNVFLYDTGASDFRFFTTT